MKNPQPNIQVAVVGHTNTGKTSLLRTLLRNDEFGEVSNRPSTTRHVERSELIFNGEHWLSLYDTPGLEDSAGLLDLIDQFDERLGVDRLLSFLQTPEAEDTFAQEAKVIRQILSCDIALYIIDAREPVLGKYQDELKILSYSAKPVTPVLNFIADNPKNRQQWHDHLAKLNLHAIVDFDTVAYSFSNEISLYRGLQTLMPEYRQYLDTLVEALNTHEQQRLVHASEILAELLVDVAAYQVKVGTDENSEQKQITMQESVKFHEQKTVRALLGAFQFHQSNFEHDVLPISNGEWQRDLFDVNYLKEVGLETSSAMAKGAAIGLTIDVFTAGLSMGAASLLGALGGALYARGRDIYEVIRGYETLRIDDNTLALIALRESQLVFALLGRGHASQSDIILHQKSEPVLDLEDIPEPIKTARLHKNWSALNDKLDENDKREATIKTLAESLRERWKQIRSQ